MLPVLVMLVGIGLLAAAWVDLRRIWLRALVPVTQPVPEPAARELLLSLEAALVTLEERIGLLDGTVAAADQRLAELRAKMRNQSRQAAVDSPARKGKRSGAASAPRPVRRRARRVQLATAMAQAAGHRGQRLPAVTLRPVEPVLEPPRWDEVYRLADEGLSAGTIATRLAMPDGEVKLMLGLRHLV